eukprot:110555-Pelagomonas_calceolata.AAC.1
MALLGPYVPSWIWAGDDLHKYWEWAGKYKHFKTYYWSTYLPQALLSSFSFVAIVNSLRVLQHVNAQGFGEQGHISRQATEKSIALGSQRVLQSMGLEEG